ncbi:Rossmann-fold NAD(P)-binding domain-containing protein [Nonomuraea jabiensis]|uniref:hypothetical protein n=1 Tax=Nonomuraea jabiensis TaxID=882448 RepID=UPI0036922016
MLVNNAGLAGPMGDPPSAMSPADRPGGVRDERRRRPHGHQRHAPPAQTLTAPGACATDFTEDLPYQITRTAADGAAVIIRLATLGPDGPTGGFYDDAGIVPW